jgi:hypothetical protein
VAFEQGDLELVNLFRLPGRPVRGGFLPWFATCFGLAGWQHLLVSVHGVILLVQPVAEALEGQVGGGRPIRVVPIVPQGEVDHAQQAVQVPAVEREGPGALVVLDLAVQPEGFGHRSGVALEFSQLFAGDE